MSGPDFSTFESRQAYIEKCEGEMRQAMAENARRRAEYEQFNAELQAILLQFDLEMTALIYRGMFDPAFCAPRQEQKPAGVPNRLSEGSSDC